MFLGLIANFEPSVPSNVEAEGKTLLNALRWAESKKWRRCDFEMDWADVFSSVSIYSGFGLHTHHWVHDCASLMLENQG